MSPPTNNVEPTVEQLVGDFKLPDWSRRIEAALILLSRASTEKDVVHGLVGALRAPTTTERELAAVVLGFLNPTATGAIPALIQALQDEHPGVRRRAAAALGRMRAEGGAAFTNLSSAMQDTNRGVRRAAASALEEINRSVSPADMHRNLRKSGPAQTLASAPEHGAGRVAPRVAAGAVVEIAGATTGPSKPKMKGMIHDV